MPIALIFAAMSSSNQDKSNERKVFDMCSNLREAKMEVAFFSTSNIIPLLACMATISEKGTRAVYMICYVYMYVYIYYIYVTILIYTPGTTDLPIVVGQMDWNKSQLKKTIELAIFEEKKNLHPLQSIVCKHCIK